MVVPFYTEKELKFSHTDVSINIVLLCWFDIYCDVKVPQQTIMMQCNPTIMVTYVY